MHETPLISIAVCTYNGEKFLAQQIESLLAQDYPNFEIIVCDDCSSDRTVEIAEGFNSPRIRLHRNEHNLGFNKNFEHAFQLCRGEFIAPCDQDDLWEPLKLSTLYAQIGTNSLAYCDSVLIDENGDSLHQKISDKLNMYSGKDWMPFIFLNCVSGHASLFRRKLLDQACPIPPKAYFDHWLAAVAASSGGLVYVDECLVHFRQHAASCTDIAGLKNKGSKNAPALAQRIDDEAAWMGHLARLGNGEKTAQIDALRALWLSKKERYLCPELALLILKHGKAIFKISQKSCITIRFAAKCFWGAKLKLLLKPKKYAAR